VIRRNQEPVVQRPSSRLLAACAVLTGLGVFAASPALAGADRVRASGELVRYAPAVPEGATARVHVVYNSAGDTLTTLHVRGLRPNTAYGAHAHANACGATGADAGPHFQNVVNPDPERPNDPRFANPANEIWLDLTTDAAGNAVATSKVAWQFSPERRAGSVIIHAEHTHTGPRDAGTAGARLACLTVGF
jgi:superoxide dismutase, Cu-Zn family